MSVLVSKVGAYAVRTLAQLCPRMIRCFYALLLLLSADLTVAASIYRDRGGRSESGA